MADFVPRYVFKATLKGQETSIALDGAQSALTVTLAPLLRGPKGDTVVGPMGPEGLPGHTPTMDELELPVDPILIFENALI